MQVQKVVILLEEYQVALHLQHAGSLGTMVICVVEFSSGGQSYIHQVL